MKIAIVDYGVGNLGSIQNMLRKAGFSATISADVETIKQADKLILPGVGAFDHAMGKLRESGLAEVIDTKVREERTPILGLCLGVQLFTEGSDEGRLPGLGWLPARTVRFDLDNGGERLTIPHMGWNHVCIRKPTVMFDTVEESPRFYFVHSYHVACRDDADVLATTVHGREFVAAVERDNIVGVQFHPEKSHRFGMALLRHFAERFGT